GPLARDGDRRGRSSDRPPHPASEHRPYKGPIDGTSVLRTPSCTSQSRPRLVLAFRPTPRTVEPPVRALSDDLVGSALDQPRFVRAQRPEAHRIGWGRAPSRRLAPDGGRGFRSMRLGPKIFLASSLVIVVLLGVGVLSLRA